MVAPAVEGIDLFKIAGRSISGWVPSLKTGTAVRQPFCSQLEERLMLWLEYHPQVKSYARGDFGQKFPTPPVEAAIWKIVGDSAADGHLLVDLEQHTLARTLPLALLPPDATPLVPDPLPDTLLPEPEAIKPAIPREAGGLVPGA